MTAFALKRYQALSLQVLEKYLRAARMQGARAAFESETGYGYNTEPFGDVPCVCLRIPTGGGKTLLAAHAVGLMAREWPSPPPKPLALWLVPSDTIRAQTLAALGAPGHPFREALAQACGDSVRVCSLDEVASLSPQDFDACAVIVAATIQSFRIEDTDQRNVYAFSEAFEPHFRGVPAQTLRALNDLPNALVTAEEAASDKAGREMLARFVGRPRWSLANWLALRQPCVIVDEAHNTKTERSFEALKRLNPSMILELTATPVPKRTNVLFHVSAQQLQAEDMIKMPIQLMEHTRGWQSAVLHAMQTQRWLEAEAQKEEAATGAYIRPIVLLQAQNSTDAVNVDVLRAHLLDELHIPEAQVKVATGALRELDGLNLAARDCAVRYIITVQALREGWDCPFAYVLCSVQSIRPLPPAKRLRRCRWPPTSGRQQCRHLGGRAHAELRIDPRPVHFDRAHRHVQLVGDHLVELAGRDALHHLVFAFGQAGEPCRALLAAGVGLVHRAVDRERLFDAVGEGVVAVRLLEKIEGAVLQRLDGHRDVAVRTQEQHRVAQAPRTQLLEHSQARHRFHAHVEQEHAGQRPRRRVDCGEQFGAAREGAHRQPTRGKQKAERVQHRGLVVEQVDGAGCCLHAVSSSDGVMTCRSTGSVIENHAPPPGDSVASSAPWWASRIERQIASPMPMPSTLVE